MPVISRHFDSRFARPCFLRTSSIGCAFRLRDEALIHPNFPTSCAARPQPLHRADGRRRYLPSRKDAAQENGITPVRGMSRTDEAHLLTGFRRCKCASQLAHRPGRLLASVANLHAVQSRTILEHSIRPGRLQHCSHDITPNNGADVAHQSPYPITALSAQTTSRLASSVHARITHR